MGRQRSPAGDALPPRRQGGAISQVGAGEAGLLQWFDPPASLPYIGQGTLSRRGDKLATLAGTDAFGPAQEQLFLYGVSSGYPTPPEPKCYVATAAPPSGKFLIPSWSPDGTELAVGESDGIHIYGNIPDLRAPDASCAQITERILVHGSAPAWGPADVAGTEPPPPPPTPSSPTRRPISHLTVERRQAGRAVRIRLRVQTADAIIRARQFQRNRLRGSATKHAARTGRLSLTVPLNRRGRAALIHRRRLRLTVRVIATAPGTSPVMASRKVTLRR